MRMFGFRYYCMLSEDYSAQYSIKNPFMKKEPLRREDHRRSKEDCAKADKQDQTRDYRWVEPKKD